MSTSRSRLTIVGIVAIALFGALFARLWFLQVANTKTYAAQTERNRIRVVREPAVRGAILDDKGRPLVQNTVVDALTVSRRITPEQKDVSFPRLAYLLAHLQLADADS